VISNSQILLVCNDPKLPEELEAALPSTGSLRPVLHSVSEFRQAAEAIRSRRPWLVIAEMGLDMRVIKSLSEEIAATSPESMLVAVFRPDVFGPDASESAVLIEAIRLGVRDFIRRPVSNHDLTQLLTRLQVHQDGAPRPLGRVISMISNKGGVGKSTLAVNSATALAIRHPGRVLLIDASLQMGVCATMLDLQPTLTLTDAYHQQDRLDELLLRQLATPHATGLHLLAAPQNAVEGVRIDDEVISRVITLARRAYDYVLIDTFPMLDRVMMAVLDLSDQVYVVIENVVPTVLSGVKLIELLDSMHFPAAHQQVVLNRYARRTGNLRPIDVAKRLGRSVDHVVPFHNRVIAAANLGRPFVLDVSRFSALGRRMRSLVREMERSMQPSGTDLAASTNGHN
jgi:pilus assembly protein CpaE